jgi:hypothetical protein
MITLYDHEDNKLYEVKKLTGFLIDDDFFARLADGDRQCVTKNYEEIILDFVDQYNKERKFYITDSNKDRVTIKIDDVEYSYDYITKNQDWANSVFNHQMGLIAVEQLP